MADKIATDFISDMKAKGQGAISWFKKIIKKTQRAAMPAAVGRKEILTDDLLFTKVGWVYQYNAIPNNKENKITNQLMKKTYNHFYGELND